MTLSRGSVRPRVVVVGGSIAGLLCALLLRRAGCEVDVFERSTGTLESRGAGIVTHPELFAVLARAGLDDEPASLGVRVPGRRLLGPDGAILAEPDLDQIVTSWGRLYRLLRTAFPTDRYHLGAELGMWKKATRLSGHGSRTGRAWRPIALLEPTGCSRRSGVRCCRRPRRSTPGMSPGAGWCKVGAVASG